MKKGITESIKKDITKIIEVILSEIELRNIQKIKGTIFVEVSLKKIEYPEDLSKLINKINEGKKRRILRLFSESEFVESLVSDKFTEESVSKLQRRRSLFELNFGYGQHPLVGDRVYFLIENIHQLRETKNKLDKEFKSYDIKSGKTIPATFKLYLDSNGNLRREASAKHYELRDEKLPKKILGLLKHAGRFQVTKEIAQEVGSTEKSVRNAIGKFNRKAGGILRLPKKHKIIEGKANSGYRINPVHQIKGIS